MRKLTSFLLAMLLLLNLAVPALAATISQEVSTASITAGSDVTVTLNLDEALTGIGSFEYTLHYNEALFALKTYESTVDVTDKPAKGEVMLSAVYDYSGDSGLTIAAGNLATLVFTATQDVTEGQRASFYLECVDISDTGFGSVEVEETGADIQVEVTPVPAPTGYSVYASADSHTTQDGTASISIYAANADVSTYNAYDLTLTYDTEKLTLKVDEEGAPTLGGAAANDEADATVSGSRIHIAGVGEDKKNADDPIVTLTFTMKASGTAEVAIAEAKVDNKGQAIAASAPEASLYGGADNTPGSALIKVPFTVEKPGFVSGEASVLPGEDYTFSFTDTSNYTYTDLAVTVGDQSAVVTDNGDGSYTVENVSGNVVITASQTPNTYDVTIDSSNTAAVTAPTTATYGTDYVFTVSPANASVSVKDADGNSISWSMVNGQYVIAGENITGSFTIKAMIEEQPANTTRITFEGITAEEIEGGLVRYAPNGQAFDFTLLIQENVAYKAMIGDEEIPLKTYAEGETEEEGKLTFTIPAERLTGTPITVTVGKTSTVLDGLTVTVGNYIQLDESMMFLVTAKAGDSALAYEDAPMYWSEKYDAYSYLVISADTADTVKAAAENAITVYTGSEEETVAYDFDVNDTSGTVDINDAQLTYDMYTAEYGSFDQVSMDKFLEADLNGDGKVYTEDVASIIYRILNPAVSEESQQ